MASKCRIDSEGRECSKCRTYKLWYQFMGKLNHPTGHNTQCVDCVKRSNKSAARTRNASSRGYHITNHKFDTILKEQGGRCAICGNELSKPCVDHDHETGKVRGLLCSKCNVGLGMFDDNPLSLFAAIQYLKLKSGPEKSFRII